MLFLNGLAKKLNGIAMIMLIAVALGAGIFISNSFRGIFSVNSETRGTMTVRALEQVNEIILLRMGIVDLFDREDSINFVPGTTSEVFIRGEFNVNLGIDGRNVEIIELSEDEFQINIPEFIILGHSDINLETAMIRNGVLSFLTPNIDKMEMANYILSDERLKNYISTNEDLLKASAKTFYEGIINAVNPEASLNFTFNN